MNETPAPRLKLHVPSSHAATMTEPQVRAELGHATATKTRLRDAALRERIEDVLRVLEAAIDIVIMAARHDGDVSDLATGTLVTNASDTILGQLETMLTTVTNDHLLKSDDLVAFEMWPRLMLVHTELRNMSMHVRFETAGKKYTDGLRTHTRLSLLMELLEEHAG